MKYVYPEGEARACIIFSHNEYGFDDLISIYDYLTVRVGSVPATAAVVQFCDSSMWF